MASKQNKKTVVLASGVFDLLHLGHVKFLEEAKKTGGKNAELIVIVARDSTVDETKGRKPIMSEAQRRALVESLKVVDEAVLGYENLDIGEVIDHFHLAVTAEIKILINGHSILEGALAVKGIGQKFLFGGRPGIDPNRAVKMQHSV